jgi:hypothetical protein
MEVNTRRIAKLEHHINWIRQNIGSGDILDKRLAEISKLRASAASDQKPRLVVVNILPLARE